jgi:hypothetical protein
MEESSPEPGSAAVSAASFRTTPAGSRRSQAHVTIRRIMTIGNWEHARLGRSGGRLVRIKPLRRRVPRRNLMKAGRPRSVEPPIAMQGGTGYQPVAAGDSPAGSLLGRLPSSTARLAVPPKGLHALRLSDSVATFTERRRIIYSRQFAI